MADEKFDSLTLVGRHVPDASLENGPDGNKVSVPLPGMYEVGVQLGGKFIALSTFKAGNLVDAKNKVKIGGKASPSGSADDDGTTGEDKS